MGAFAGHEKQAQQFEAAETLLNAVPGGGGGLGRHRILLWNPGQTKLITPCLYSSSFKSRIHCIEYPLHSTRVLQNLGRPRSSGTGL